MSTPPTGWEGADKYLVTYEDGATRTIWGYSIRYAADVSEDPYGVAVVKIERVTP